MVLLASRPIMILAPCSSGTMRSVPDDSLTTRARTASAIDSPIARRVLLVQLSGQGIYEAVHLSAVTVITALPGQQANGVANMSTIYPRATGHAQDWRPE